MYIEWITAGVEAVKEHYVECRRSHIGRPMRVAYVHVRLVTDNALAREIAQSYEEDDIADTDAKEIRTIDQMSMNTSEDIYEDICGHDRDIDDKDELRPIGTVSSLLI